MLIGFIVHSVLSSYSTLACSLRMYKMPPAFWKTAFSVTVPAAAGNKKKSAKGLPTTASF